MDENDPLITSAPPYIPYPTVLVTGAAGFVGIRVCRLLRRRGVKVVALDNLRMGRPLPAADDRTVPVELDIRDRSGLASVVRAHDPDAVIHLAAIHHIPTCERNPALAFDTNVMGTQNILDSVEDTACRAVVTASSGAVYAWSGACLSEEESTLDASDVYSTTKLTNEYQLRTWTDRTQRRAHVGRLFNTIGRDDPNNHLIPDILHQLHRLDDGPRTIRLGNISPKRDYVYVDDAASGFIAILYGLDAGPLYDAFNIARGEEFSVADLVDIMARHIGAQVSIEPDPARVRARDRPSQLGDPTKMKQRFGWQARHSLAEALRKIMQALPQ